MDGKSPRHDETIRSCIFFLRTALHWACKRNHISIIRYLLARGADISIRTDIGENAKTLSSSKEALTLLGCPEEEHEIILKSKGHSNAAIMPHYLQNPPFPYQDIQEEPASKNGPVDTQTENKISSSTAIREATHITSERDITLHECSSTGMCPLLLKVRLSGIEELDFVEVEVMSLTYRALLEACAEELEVEVSQISKIRKLPDVLVRKDRDVERMNVGQNLEVVLI